MDPNRYFELEYFPQTGLSNNILSLCDDIYNDMLYDFHNMENRLDYDIEGNLHSHLKRYEKEKRVTQQHYEELFNYKPFSVALIEYLLFYKEIPLLQSPNIDNLNISVLDKAKQLEELLGYDILFDIMNESLRFGDSDGCFG